MARESSGWSLLLVLVTGCGLILNVDPDRKAAGDSGPVSDVGDDASVDLYPPLDCGEEDDGVLAYYRMEHPDGHSELIDTLGMHDASFVQDSFRGIEGICGTAFDTGNLHAAVIPHDEVFRLPAGSVDLHLLPGSVDAGDCRSPLGRDATGSMLSGHFSIMANDEGHIGVRLQGSESLLSTCVFSNAPLRDSWHFIAINFGPGGLELYVDGVAQTNTDGGSCQFNTVEPQCMTGCETGIDGNANPWVVGAAAFATEEGGADATDISDHYRGAIDEVRISNGPRAYAGFDPLP